MRNSAQYALDCMTKHFKVKNVPAGGPLDPFTVKYFFCQIFNPPPPPLTENLEPPLISILWQAITPAHILVLYWW